MNNKPTKKPRFPGYSSAWRILGRGWGGDGPPPQQQQAAERTIQSHGQISLLGPTLIGNASLSINDAHRHPHELFQGIRPLVLSDIRYQSRAWGPGIPNAYPSCPIFAVLAIIQAHAASDILVPNQVTAHRPEEAEEI
jgi:hypothetical protein